MLSDRTDDDFVQHFMKKMKLTLATEYQFKCIAKHLP